MGCPRRVVILKILCRHPQGLEALAILVVGEIQSGHAAQGFHFQRIAAPAKAQAFQHIYALRRFDSVGVQARIHLIIDCLGGKPLIAAILHGGKQRHGLGVIAGGRLDTGAHQLGFQRIAGGQGRRQMGDGGIRQLQPPDAQRRIGIRQPRARLPIGGIAFEDRAGQDKIVMRRAPVFQRRFGQAAPQSSMRIEVERTARQIIVGGLVAAHHVIGAGAHDRKLGIAVARRVLCLNQVDQPQRFRSKTVGKIEARQFQSRMIGRGGG